MQSTHENTLQPARQYIWEDRWVRVSRRFAKAHDGVKQSVLGAGKKEDTGQKMDISWPAKEMHRKGA